MVTNAQIWDYDPTTGLRPVQRYAHEICDNLFQRLHETFPTDEDIPSSLLLTMGPEPGHLGFWSENEPVPAEEDTEKVRTFYIGRERLFKWIEFVLNEGYVQFGPQMYCQSSGIFMGSSPAPDLANYFAFIH